MLVAPNRKIAFTKMSGLGNDFVIFDARSEEINLSEEQISKISQKNNSKDNIGCDQLIIIKNADDATCLMEIYNSDGSKAGACGNATRCVAAILFDEINTNSVTIKTSAGILPCSLQNNNEIAVNIGIPKFNWQEIPLSKNIDSQKINFFDFEFACVNVGNPHAVTFIKNDISDEVFFDIGPKIENNPLFSEKTNVEFAKIISDNLIEVRVWERGAGETLACGTGACAVAILAIKKQLINSNETTIRFKGGDLKIKYSNNQSVIMCGGYKYEFKGHIDNEFFN